ncbi:MAG: DEAD/DEAH box helicase, partial [Deltaproteobacteria bacterium]
MTAPSSPAAAFAALGIAPPLANALATRGFTELTPVQYALIDPAHANRDLLVSAMTGSGKTVAFGLLVAPSLEGTTPATSRGAAPRAIVITPTRELANQVREELAWLLAAISVRVVVVTGGTSVSGERRALAAGADIVVGTPGRLQDHLEHNAIDGSKVQTVVLDEADEMLDMGFRDELDSILKTMPADRRTVMLSATVPREIEDLARNYQRNPARVAIDPPGQSNENISFVAHLVPPSSRVDVVVNLLLAAQDERTMVFVRTRADATDLGAQLSQLGFTAAALQGEMGQRERTQTLDSFRAGRVQVLVATDVAARGLDVPEVTMIIHADLPGDPSALTHRSGRTGRAGRHGTSVLLVPSFARRRAEAMLRVMQCEAKMISGRLDIK